MAISPCKALQGAAAAQDFGAEQNKEFRMVDMHAEMALVYGIGVTVATTGFAKLDMMVPRSSAWSYRPKPAIAETSAHDSE